MSEDEEEEPNNFAPIEEEDDKVYSDD